MSKTRQEVKNDAFLKETFGLTTQEFKDEIGTQSIEKFSNNPKDTITLLAQKNGESYIATYSEPELQKLLKDNGVSF
jgi:hypothetical protein